MTESEWLECTDPTPMLSALAPIATVRKWCLLGSFWWRHVYEGRTAGWSLGIVECAEQAVDGGTSQKRLRRYARERLESKVESPNWGAQRVALIGTRDNSTRAFVGIRALLVAWRDAAFLDDEVAIATLRDVFSNPFRPVTINPTWLSPTVINLARAAYEERIMPSGELEPARLAVLSDCLEESGCDEDILDHLRSAGPHVRGCWGLDLILGKE
jgi:hypothetical protein